MVGDAEITVSPSSSSTRRSTPCVLGCCGPMLTVIVSVRTSAISVQKRQHEGHGGKRRTRNIFSRRPCPLLDGFSVRELRGGCLGHDLVNRSRLRFARNSSSVTCS